MTVERSIELHTKHYYDTKDIMELRGVCKATASKIMTDIRRWAKANGTIRQDTEGRVDKQDYFDFFRLSPQSCEIKIYLTEANNG